MASSDGPSMIGGYPAPNPYKETKTRANGASYVVYVQPFYTDLLDATGVVKTRVLRKVQSDPIGSKEARSEVLASLQAVRRAGERAREFQDQIAAYEAAEAAKGPRVPQTLREVAEEMHSTAVRHDSEGRPRGLKGSSATKYKKHMANLGRDTYDPPLADKNLAQISVGDARRHFRAYANTHLASGLEKYRAYLVQIGGYAETCGYWPKNVFKELPSVHVPEQEEADNLALSLLDIRKLNRQARESQNARLPAYLRLLRVALRASEVVALTEDDVDFENRFIYVRYSLTQEQPDWAKAQGRKAVAYLEETKTRESRRKIKMHASFMADLKESLKLAEECEIPSYDDRGKTRARRFVVPNKQGRVWLYNNALRLVRKDVYLAAGIDLRKYDADAEASKENARWNHIWRNTYAADLVALGADDLQLALLVRHTDANLTKQVYASVRLDQRDLYRSYAEKIHGIHDFNWQLGQLDEDVDQDDHRFTQRQATLKDVESPNFPENVEELFE